MLDVYSASPDGGITYAVDHKAGIPVTTHQSEDTASCNGACAFGCRVSPLGHMAGQIGMHLRIQGRPREAECRCWHAQHCSGVIAACAVRSITCGEGEVGHACLHVEDGGTKMASCIRCGICVPGMSNQDGRQLDYRKPTPSLSVLSLTNNLFLPQIKKPASVASATGILIHENAHDSSTNCPSASSACTILQLGQIPNLFSTSDTGFVLTPYSSWSLQSDVYGIVPMYCSVSTMAAAEALLLFMAALSLSDVTGVCSTMGCFARSTETASELPAGDHRGSRCS